MFKLKLILILALLLLFVPIGTFALEMPSSQNDWLGSALGLTAQSYIVVDNQSGQVLLEKNAQTPWVPASITKLVTVLVLLDSKSNLNKIVTMDSSDNIAGGCSDGGACIYTQSGIKYRLKDLLYATLMASANNAAHAVSRSMGLSQDDFVKLMNQKAQALGATRTVFYEPTGMDPRNTTTAEDYAKIAKAAFSQSLIHQIATTSQYRISATNSKRYVHVLKNTDRLLTDPDLEMVGGKTGYLDESQYNFVSMLRDRFQNEFTIAVFGSQNTSTEFSETKQLASVAGLIKAFNTYNASVLGTSTVASALNN